MAHVTANHAIERQQKAEAAELANRVVSNVVRDPERAREAVLSSQLSFARFSQVQELQAALRQANETLTAKNHDLVQLNRENGQWLERHTRLEKEVAQLRQTIQRHKAIAAKIKLGQTKHFRPGTLKKYQAEMEKLEAEQKKRRDELLDKGNEILAQLGEE